MLKKNKKIIAILFFGFIVILIFLYKAPPTLNDTPAPDFASISYPSEYNYKQSRNDCGPFNTAAVVRTLKKEAIDSSKFAEEMKWRLPNKYTIPWGLEKQLKENEITIDVPNLSPLSDEKKLTYLKQNLSAEKPIILLIKQEKFQHYITLFGYDQDKFHIYNSLYDDDENGENPGNRNLTSDELLKSWEEGGMYGLFTWYAIVNSY